MNRRLETRRFDGAVQRRYAGFLQPRSSGRDAIANLVARADVYDVPAFVLVNNKAEGCSPESLVELARRIVEKRALRA